MILFHGSDCVVKSPDTLHSGERLDFGKGFYATSVKFQSERWAKRRAAIRRSGKAFVSVFEFEENASLDIKDFSEDLEGWLEFVIECRSGSEIFSRYDLIKGKVADDKVFRVVDMYKRGIWEKERALREMKLYEMYDQFAFVSRRAIETTLAFSRFYEVDL